MINTFEENKESDKVKEKESNEIPVAIDSSPARGSSLAGALEFDIIVSSIKYHVKLNNPKKETLEKLRGNAFARIFYMETVKELYKQAREVSIKETDKKCEELGLTHDKIARGKPRNSKSTNPKVDEYRKYQREQYWKRKGELNNTALNENLSTKKQRKFIHKADNMEITRID